MIPEGNPYNNWSGNGSTTTFDFDFYIEDSSQLEVYYTDTSGTQVQLTEDVDYTINEVGNEDGSYITFPVSTSSYSVLKEGEVISLVMSVPITQEEEYTISSKLNLEQIEYSLDKLTRICKILKRELERSVKVAEGSDVDTDELVVNINTLVGCLSTIETVYNNLSNIGTTAENITDVNTCAANIEDIQNASENAQTAITKAAEASTSADNAQIWAEGDDEEVEELGGTHSSLVSAGLSYAYANADEDTAVEDFLLNNQVVIKGEKGNEAYTPGTGIDITDGVITNSMPGQWGKITGTVSMQTDLQNALNKKANAADVPTKTSELINNSNYITSTDYADINSSGVVRVAGKYGTHMSDEYLCISRAAKSDIDAKTHQYRPITPYTLDYAVKTSLSTNTEILTDDEKSAIREWLGINEDWVKNIVSEVINGSDEDTSGTDDEYSDEEAPSL